MVRMEMGGQPQQMPEVQVEVLALARLHHDARLSMGSLKRFAFYKAARQAFVWWSNLNGHNNRFFQEPKWRKT